MKKNGFTLSELLIVLVIIGIISAIVVPMIHNLMPDRDKMRYMKAYNTITTILSEFVQDDELFFNGNLSDVTAPNTNNNNLNNCSGNDKLICLLCNSISTTNFFGNMCMTTDGLRWQSVPPPKGTYKRFILYLYPDNVGNISHTQADFDNKIFSFDISENGNIILDNHGEEYVRSATNLKRSQ